MTKHILDAHPNSKLKIKKEYTDKKGNLDIPQLLDDIDLATEDHSDIDTIRMIVHEARKRVKYSDRE